MTPTTLAEYEERFAENVRTERRRGEDVLCLPCPFCAARDWYVVPADELQHSTTAMYCVSCERSARFEKVGDQLELVQVAGPKPPEWLPNVRHEASRFVAEGLGRLPGPGHARGGLLRSAAPEPPNYRTAVAGSGERCGTCKMYDDSTGECWGYGNTPVSVTKVCDSWTKDTSA